MTTHSKGKYIAYRSGRNKPTHREIKARERIEKWKIHDELLKFCEEPFPNGATIIEWNGVEGGIKP